VSWRDELEQWVIFHTDHGSTYTARVFTKLCAELRISGSEGAYSDGSISSRKFAPVALALSMSPKAAVLPVPM